MWTRLARPSLSGTLLGLMGSRSLKELMSPQEPMDRTLLSMILTTESLLQLPSNRLLPPTNIITMSRPITMSSQPRLPTQTGTLSSTPMTQPIKVATSSPNKLQSRELSLHRTPTHRTTTLITTHTQHRLPRGFSPLVNCL